MLEWQRTVISQYASAATINALLESWNDCIDPRANLAAFYAAVWDINTRTLHLSVEGPDLPEVRPGDVLLTIRPSVMTWNWNLDKR